MCTWLYMSHSDGFHCHRVCFEGNEKYLLFIYPHRVFSRHEFSIYTHILFSFIFPFILFYFIFCADIFRIFRFFLISWFRNECHSECMVMSINFVFLSLSLCDFLATVSFATCSFSLSHTISILFPIRLLLLHFPQFTIFATVLFFFLCCFFASLGACGGGGLLSAKERACLCHMHEMWMLCIAYARIFSLHEHRWHIMSFVVWQKGEWGEAVLCICHGFSSNVDTKASSNKEHFDANAYIF